MITPVVFDCVVFLQAAARPNSPARACLDRLDQGDLTLCLSTEVLAEVTDVLSRPKTRRRFPQLTQERTRTFLEKVRAKATFFDSVPNVFSLARDPDDEPYVNLALAAGAKYLVTRDKDLLDLMSDQMFQQRFPHLTILEPAAFLRSVSPKSEPPLLQDTREDKPDG
jgi:putative PIN family toxin of toxin-antitoxin system